MDTAYTAVTEHTKDRLWEEMWDVARYVQYYAMQTNRLARWNKVVRFCILVGAALAVGSTADLLPAVYGIAGGLTLLVLTAVDFIWDWGTKAALSHAISLECCVIEKDYESLWSQVKTEQIGDRACQEQINHLAMRVMAATAQLSETDRGLNRKAQEAAAKVLADRWGGTIESPTGTATSRA